MSSKLARWALGASRGSGGQRKLWEMCANSSEPGGSPIKPTSRLRPQPGDPLSRVIVAVRPHRQSIALVPWICPNAINLCALAGHHRQRDRSRSRLLYRGAFMADVLSKPGVATREPGTARVAHSSSLFQRIWAPAILILGLALTIAWTALLGYVLALLVRLAF